MGGITTEELQLNPDSYIKTAPAPTGMIYSFVHPDTGKKVTFRVQTNPAGFFECVVTWVDVVSKEVFGNSDIDRARQTWNDVIHAGYVLTNTCKDWNMSEFHKQEREKEKYAKNSYKDMWEKDINKFVNEFVKQCKDKNYALEA